MQLVRCKASSTKLTELGHERGNTNLVCWSFTYRGDSPEFCVQLCTPRGRARGRGRARNPARSQDVVFGAIWQKSRALIEKSGSLALWGISVRFQWGAVRLLEVKTGWRTFLFQIRVFSPAPKDRSPPYLPPGFARCLSIVLYSSTEFAKCRYFVRTYCNKVWKESCRTLLNPCLRV